ncbi:MAG: dephospho-CoA kinase [Lachnospiraceae bacterium]|nr:dephospho-CoA kinase [Lachnospiraceae bacterium]
MKFIGITGGIGAGKSTVLDYIRANYSCVIYLADDVAKELEAPGMPVYRELVELLGEEILSKEFGVDPADQQEGLKLRPIDTHKMAKKIFADESLLKAVNAIVHPAVRIYLTQRLEEERSSGKTELFFVEAALLIEAGYREFVDEMWYIYADPETRMERLMKNRGYSRDKAAGIMERQLSDEEFRSTCDIIIDNSGEPEETYRQIREILGDPKGETVWPE